MVRPCMFWTWLTQGWSHVLCCVVQKCLLVLGGSTCCFVLDIRTHELLDKIGSRRGARTACCVNPWSGLVGWATTTTSFGGYSVVDSAGPSLKPKLKVALYVGDSDKASFESNPTRPLPVTTVFVSNYILDTVSFLYIILHWFFFIFICHDLVKRWTSWRQISKNRGSTN